ncbi:hypothetical protein BDR07DRAFT_1397096 [Suillus spraguei]|nr:hypothetical protein BDR07DRAFT_1397096 [Suillus spraguei]
MPAVGTFFTFCIFKMSCYVGIRVGDVNIALRTVYFAGVFLESLITSDYIISLMM